MARGDLASALRRTRQAMLLACALGALGVVTGCGGGSSRSASSQACGDAVLSDWGANGQVDGAYDADCYLLAVDALPEDVRSYTSAADDILRALRSTRESAGSLASTESPGAFTRALSSARGAAPEPATSPALRRPPGPVVLLGALCLVAVAGIVAPLAARRVRRGS